MASRIISIFFLLAFLFSCTTKESIVQPDADIAKDVTYRDALLWVFKPSVNVRETASGSADKISSLVDGDSVIVLKNVDGWYKIKTIEGRVGWIRSDLLGPRELSAFNSAVAFIEDLEEEENIELFFDKNLLHKRVYLSYPPELYFSPQDVETRTRDLLKKYQEQVYRGNVTARVLKPGTDEEYLTVEAQGVVNADPILPVIPFGRIETVNRDNPSGIKLTYSIPEEISDDQLIATARQIVPEFPISYQSVEITFKDSPYTKNKPCRLWYIEDKNGEEYKIGECN